MPESTLKVTVDKFTFNIPAGLFYSEAGLWVKPEGNRVRLGLSDFTQQHGGDVTFANTKPAGTGFEGGGRVCRDRDSQSQCHFARTRKLDAG